MTAPTLLTTPVRTRFAPSPTGSLHVGGGRTALFTWLLAHGEAKRAGREGAFLLRIEDTDRTRLVEGATEGILDILAWFGLTWDEGPDRGGPHAPYIQSERLAIYTEHAERLLATGAAYRCFCTPERLTQLRDQQRARGEPPGYDRHCRDLPAETVADNLAAEIPSVVRFAMPRERETRFTDLLRGEIVYQNATLDDAILLKRDGYPTYHLANVVDDHAMEISHVTRAEEWIPSTPLHVQLYQAFGWAVPTLAHMPLILAPGGGKLSKRHGATAMEEFRAQGYLPEALMNYLALLGWSFDGQTELFSPAELLEKFSLARVSPSPATFDYAKLRWFNQQWINHQLDLDDVTRRVVPFLVAAGLADDAASDPAGDGFAAIREAVALQKDRMELLSEAPDLLGYFLRDALPPYEAELLVPKGLDQATTLDALIAVEAAMDDIDVADEAATEAALRALAGDRGLKAGQLFMPIRVAVTGRTHSPGLFATLRVVGQARCRARLAAAIDSLRAHGDETLSADD
jgi:glutamyl-tRNA synthetase